MISLESVITSRHRLSASHAAVNYYSEAVPVLSIPGLGGDMLIMESEDSFRLLTFIFTFG